MQSRKSRVYMEQIPNWNGRFHIIGLLVQDFGMNVQYSTQPRSFLEIRDFSWYLDRSI